ncbi:MAG: hypothetical protein PHV68_08630, partial [Candidatus Gastranaerophilales bacterium]|nr:hypothetical protein [Candidatus Gastranaerophilales bacterium]
GFSAIPGVSPELMGTMQDMNNVISEDEDSQINNLEFQYSSRTPVMLRNLNAVDAQREKE